MTIAAVEHTKAPNKKEPMDIRTALLAVLVFLTFPVAVYYDGFTISRLWGWFVVPQFGLAPMSVPIAAGLSLLYAFTRAKIGTKDTRTPRESINAVLWLMWGVPTVALVSGRVLHHFAASHS